MRTHCGQKNLISSDVILINLSKDNYKNYYNSLLYNVFRINDDKLSAQVQILSSRRIGY